VRDQLPQLPVCCRACANIPVPLCVDNREKIQYPVKRRAELVVYSNTCNNYGRWEVIVSLMVLLTQVTNGQENPFIKSGCIAFLPRATQIHRKRNRQARFPMTEPVTRSRESRNPLRVIAVALSRRMERLHSCVIPRPKRKIPDNQSPSRLEIPWPETWTWIIGVTPPVPPPANSSNLRRPSECSGRLPAILWLQPVFFPSQPSQKIRRIRDCENTCVG